MEKGKKGKELAYNILFFSLFPLSPFPSLHMELLLFVKILFQS